MENIDDYLMTQFASGDKIAFTQLVNRHKRTIFQFILTKVRDRDIASDLTQDVFVRLFNSAEKYNPSGQFKSWLFKMTQNICYDALRKTQKASLLSLDSGIANNNEDNLSLIDQIEDDSSHPEKETEFFELQQIIDQTLENLSEKHRTAFILCQFHGMNYSEIAEIQNCPLGTVKSRVHKALTTIRDRLKELDML